MWLHKEILYSRIKKYKTKDNIVWIINLRWPLKQIHSSSYFLCHANHAVFYIKTKHLYFFQLMQHFLRLFFYFFFTYENETLIFPVQVFLCMWVFLCMCRDILHKNQHSKLTKSDRQRKIDKQKKSTNTHVWSVHNVRLYDDVKC